MAVSCCIVAPLRRETVRIEFFYDGAPIRTRTDSKYIAAAFDATEQQSFVKSQSDLGAAIDLAAATPNQTSCGSTLVALTLDFDVRSAGNRKGYPRRAACKKRFVDVPGMRLYSVMARLRRSGPLAEQMRAGLRVRDRAYQSE